MNPVTPFRWIVLGAGALVGPAVAHAHSGLGASDSLIAGCAHPVSGWDHFLAFVAIGVWAAQLGGRARWAVPASVLGAMACGAALGARGLPLPGLEPVISTTVLLAGLLVAAAVRVAPSGSVPLVALVAFLHGAAHGAEMPLAAGGLAYAAGFLLVTAALLAAGGALGAAAARTAQRGVRVLGGLVAVTGLALLLG